MKASNWKSHPLKLWAGSKVNVAYAKPLKTLNVRTGYTVNQRYYADVLAEYLETKGYPILQTFVKEDFNTCVLETLVGLHAKIEKLEKELKESKV